MVVGSSSHVLSRCCPPAQAQDMAIATAANVGSNFGVIGGLLYDRFGPRTAARCAVACCTVGYAVLWLSTSAIITPNVALMAAGAFVFGLGNSTFDTCAMSCNMGNFANDRGRVAGLLKGVVGLSASIMATFYLAFFSPDIPTFMLFLGVVVNSTVALASFGLRALPSGAGTALGKGGLRRLNIAYVLVLVIMTYLMSAGISNSVLHLDGFARGFGVALVPLLCAFFLLVFERIWLRDQATRLASSSRRGLGVFIGAPTKGLRRVLTVGTRSLGLKFLPFDGESVRSVREHRARTMSRALEEEVAATPMSPALSAARAAIEAGAADADKSVSWRAALCMREFWLLEFIAFAIAGAGLTFVNNLGSIALALHENVAGSQNVMVVIFSVAGCGGRLLVGFLADVLAARISRAGLIAIVVAIMCGAQLFLAFSSYEMLFFATVCVGGSFGSFWTLFPAACADIFGMHSFGAIYQLMMASGGLASYLCSVLLASSVYEAHIADGGVNCVGQLCYRDVFFVLSGLCSGAFVCSVILARRLEARDAAAVAAARGDDDVELDIKEITV